jgi:hypothetical protein
MRVSRFVSYGKLLPNAAVHLRRAKRFKPRRKEVTGEARNRGVRWNSSVGFRRALRLPKDLRAPLLGEHLTINHFTLALDLIRQKAFDRQTVAVIKIDLNRVRFLVRRRRLDSHIKYNSRSPILSRYGRAWNDSIKLSMSF